MLTERGSGTGWQNGSQARGVTLGIELGVEDRVGSWG
jgi:hypothetical protein